MTITDTSDTGIHITLKHLIEAKARRDNSKFSACQLAEALDMPRSMITKLTHFDKTKRVTNPRIDTLLKIVDYFRADGFNVSIEDLIGRDNKIIDIRTQPLNKDIQQTIPIFSFHTSQKKLGLIDVKLSSNKNNAFGLLTEQDVRPFFKAGSIFIVDPLAALEDGVLVAIKTPTNNVQIKKYCVIKNKIILKALDENDKELTFMSTANITLLGVVIQVNAKTS